MLGIVSVAVALVLLLALPYLLPDREQHSLNEQARNKATGRFAVLPEGQVHYELQGAEDGAVVVLLNGVATPYYLWDGVVGNLVGAGFRVLRYDYFGRGFSDRPPAEYGTDLFDRQLSGLLDCLGISSPVALIGVSLGGGIAVTFAERHPGRVSALVLLAPAGFNKLPKLAQIVTIPLIGHWVMKAFGDCALLRAIRSELNDRRLADEVSAKFAEQMRFKGFKHAMRSTFRDYSFDLSREYRQVARSGIPVLVIWGRQDSVLPIAQLEHVRTAIPDSEVSILEQAGHVVVFEQPQRVAPVMIQFLQRKLSADAGTSPEASTGAESLS